MAIAPFPLPWRIGLLGSLLGLGYGLPLEAATFSSQSAPGFDFLTVVNNGDIIPGTNRLFNGYNPPSVNDQGLVVFRARSRGGSGLGQPATGIFQRDMLGLGAVEAIAVRGGLVPDPNNTAARFTEFPSFPRLDQSSALVASRGQSNPIWELLDPVTGETETRLGTSGIYANPAGSLTSGVTQLGAVPGFDYFAVPGVGLPTRFDQFPGGPSPTAGGTVVFKGNWSDPVSGDRRTGVYFRDLLANGGRDPVQRIADSTTLIPGDNPLGIPFGATAPPSAAGGQAVFLGVDNEDSPTLGGVYRVSLAQPTQLDPLITLGTRLPGLDQPLTRIGEALSFDGERVAFWGAIGEETRPLTLFCPEEGNQDRLAYCRQQYPNGFETQVPVHQGIFLTDVNTKETRIVAQTGQDGLADFLFWNFSGRPPGVGGGEDEEGDLELARWRSTPFLATDSGGAVFKATKTNALDGVSSGSTTGIYARLKPHQPLLTVVDTTMLGEVLDPAAAGLAIADVAIERDGYRGGWLALTASMAGAETEETWAGVYLSPAPRVPEPSLVVGLGLTALWGLRRRGRRP